MQVKGAAENMLADARAAVRNSASRRLIGPVICFEDESAGAAKGYSKRLRNTRANEGALYQLSVATSISPS